MTHIGRGDFYEDCASQPVLCTEVDYANDRIAGISLLSGLVDTCSIENCGVRKLQTDEAINRALNWENWTVEAAASLLATSVDGRAASGAETGAPTSSRARLRAR